MFSQRLKILEQPQYTNMDMATGLLTDGNLGETYVTSLYCHDKRPAVPLLFKKLERQARIENKQLLVLSDTNSWSPALWQGKYSNKRGEAWERYLESINHRLQVQNKGDKFTFINSIGESIIDVTFATPRLARNIEHWSVEDWVPQSDHFAISFVLYLKNGMINPGQRWNFRRASDEAKAEYTRRLEEEGYDCTTPDDQWNMLALQREALLITQDLSDECDVTFERAQVCNAIRSPCWWDWDCTQLKKK